MEKKSFANLQILKGLFTNKNFCLGMSVALAYATCESPGSISHTLSSISRVLTSISVKMAHGQKHFTANSKEYPNPLLTVPRL